MQATGTANPADEDIDSGSLADLLKHQTIDENGLPHTDYIAKFGIDQKTLDNMASKWKKDKDFVVPETDAEREYAIDSIIA